MQTLNVIRYRANNESNQRNIAFDLYFYSFSDRIKLYIIFRHTEACGYRYRTISKINKHINETKEISVNRNSTQYMRNTTSLSPTEGEKHETTKGNTGISILLDKGETFRIFLTLVNENTDHVFI